VGLVSDSQSLHGAGAEVLDDHVGDLDEFEEDGPSIRVLEVQGDAPLVPVEVDVVGAALLDEGRELPRVVPSPRYLNLDHVRAHVR